MTSGRYALHPVADPTRLPCLVERCSEDDDQFPPGFVVKTVDANVLLELAALALARRIARSS